MSCSAVSLRMATWRHGADALWASSWAKAVAPGIRVTAALRPSWSSEIIAMFRRKDGRTLHVRKATLAELDQLRICIAPGLDPQPGKTSRMIV